MIGVIINPCLLDWHLHREIGALLSRFYSFIYILYNQLFTILCKSKVPPRYYLFIINIQPLLRN